MSYASPILPSQFEQQFVDIDFDRTAEDTGNMTGCIWDFESDQAAAWPEFEAVEQLIPREQWPDLIAKIDSQGGWLERRIRKIHSQGSEPSCVYNAAAQGTEITWNKQFGDHNWVELSPISGYRYNGSRWSGSSVPGALDWMVETGLLPTNNASNIALADEGKFKVTHPNTGYGVDPPAGWRDTAKIFRVHEFLKLSSVNAWFSALFCGFVCIGGRDRHCVVHTRPIVDGKSFLSMYANSWGGWGAERAISPLSGQSKGFGFDTESKVKTMTSRGAWAIRSVLVPPWLE